jgi:hypothetical protein
LKEFAMVRQSLLACLAMLTVAVFLTSASARADEPDITGDYKCEGTNPEGKTYRGTVEITKKGDAYLLKWTLNAGDTYAGVGILEGDVLGVSYPGGVIVYRVTKGGKLVGKWALAEGKGKAYAETLIK